MGILNYWKLDGKPTSYNPLPVGYNTIDVNYYKRYAVRFRAKSQSKAQLRIQGYNPATSSVIFNLTPVIKEYEGEVSPTSGYAQIYLHDLNSSGDIVIEDIEVIEKPLGKLTLNGVSNKVIDWQVGTFSNDNQNLEDSTRLRMKNTIPLESKTTYSLSKESNDYEFLLYEFDNNNQWKNTTYGTGWLSDSLTFTTSSATTKGRIAVRRKDVGNIDIDEIKNVNVSLVKGNQVIPYEDKQGDRMVNPKPSNKNHLFDISKTITLGSPVITETEYNGIPALRIQAVAEDRVSFNNNINWIDTITASFYYNMNSGNPDFNIYLFQEGTTYGLLNEDYTKSYTSNRMIATGKKGASEGTRASLGIIFDSDIDVTIYGIQLEKGNAATSYVEPKVDVVPKSKRQNTPDNCLILDGKSSVNIGSIPLQNNNNTEIEVSFSTVNKNTNLSMIVDKYNVGTEAQTNYGYSIFMDNQGYISVRYGEGYGADNLGGVDLRDGKIHTVRFTVTNGTISIYIDGSLVNTGDVSNSLDIAIWDTYIGNRGQYNYFFKGNVYKVTIDGKTWDFTENTPVKQFLGLENLLPTFDSGEWSLHANAKVYGPTVLKMNATGAAQYNTCYVSMEGGASYLFTSPSMKGYYDLRYYDANNNSLGNVYMVEGETRGFVTPAECVKLSVIANNGTETGDFTFVNPSLVKAKNESIAIQGNPTSKLKAPKRLLHRKR